MSRADRLFRIVSLLKQEKLVTARALSQYLEVSERTIYRDIAQLMASGVQITGEPGIGYKLENGFEMPALNFSIGELQALLLGARMLRTWADEEIADDAFNLLRKVESALPDSLRRSFCDLELFAPPVAGNISKNLAPLRHALNSKRKVQMNYTKENGESSQRTVHPLGLFFWGKAWTMVGWCETRNDFRHFRIDRIQEYTLLEETFQVPEGRSLNDYLNTIPKCPY